MQPLTHATGAAGWPYRRPDYRPPMSPFSTPRPRLGPAEAGDCGTTDGFGLRTGENAG